MAKCGMEDYLPASEIIDWQNPTVLALAKEIASDYPPHTSNWHIKLNCLENKTGKPFTL
jgi:hypothetical protein